MAVPVSEEITANLLGRRNGPGIRLLCHDTYDKVALVKRGREPTRRMRSCDDEKVIFFTVREVTAEKVAARPTSLMKCGV